MLRNIDGLNNKEKEKLLVKLKNRESIFLGKKPGYKYVYIDNI